MRTVQIYVGRDVTDLDCIRVTFTLDGNTQTIDVPLTGSLNDKPIYEYNIDLTEGDYIITEDGDYVVTEDLDYLITENSIFTPSIYIYWDGTEWVIEIIINEVTYTYCSPSDVYYPFLNNWELCDEGATLEYLITEPCVDLKYERLELFDDEKINITLNVQNLSDISKTFTDFSQSFTVPGSIVNNRIFEHFYQNDVDGTIDHNLKRPAYIEIDYIPFRRGVLMLEKSNVKNGLIDNYSVSFFGQLTSLKDIFGEVKLNQLDLNSLNFEYTAANVYDRITDTATDYDVRFPLIANNRLWTYADGGPEDITLNANAVNYVELFPSVKIARVFDAMEVYFGITFISQFFSDSRFTECFLHAKNTTNMSFLTESKDIIFDSIINTVGPDLIIYPPDYIEIPTSTIEVFYNPNNVISHSISIARQSMSGAGTYYIEVYINGVYSQTLSGTDLSIGINEINISNTAGLNNLYTFKVKASASISIDFNITYAITRLISGIPTNYFSEIQCLTVSLSGDLNVSNYLPDVKVADFFSGILKQFNLTCVGIEQNIFKIEPLEDWYNEGTTIDVTPFTDVENIDIARVPLYRNISFKYQQSESFTNRNYFAISNSEYGNTNNVFNYDGGDYTIESPFENLLFTRSVGSLGQEAILGYFLNENYQSYIPKPTLLYLYGLSDTLTTNIKYYNGVGYNNISSYALFGQDLEVNSTNYSLNFGADNSIILNETIQNGLFATYYFSYLSNLYDLKQRLTTVKAMLPLSVLTNLQLNDRLIIRDKRYIINDIKMELTSGEATLTLYNDFRDIKLSNYQIIDSGLNIVVFLIPYRDNNNSATIVRTPAGMSLSTNSVTWADGDFNPKFVFGTVTSNTTGMPRQFTVTITYVNGATSTRYVIQEG